MSAKCELCEGRKWVLGFGGIRQPCSCVSVSKDSKIDKCSKEYRGLKKQQEA